ncbi:hypothetical protein SUGI_1199210 [Cryptomeria japonica]|nr:hypothetical protein SUGI_1199210 [Cryptomeria japonica]
MACKLCTVIWSVYTVYLCFFSPVSARTMPAIEARKAWRDRDSVSHNERGITMQEDNEVKVEVGFKSTNVPFNVTYEMLPKGPVLPSGPSPCHNAFPQRDDPNAYFPCRDSDVP